MVVAVEIIVLQGLQQVREMLTELILELLERLITVQQVLVAIIPAVVVAALGLQPHSVVAEAGRE